MQYFAGHAHQLLSVADERVPDAPEALRGTVLANMTLMASDFGRVIYLTYLT